MLLRDKPSEIISADAALPGRTDPIPTADQHHVLDRPLKAEAPDGFETIYLGLGCFWGAERIFWQKDGVWLTAVGYQGGHTPNPTYEEVCSGRTGHSEIVKVIFDPTKISLDSLLATFWEAHVPTQGMRQGNDIGTQYRSAIYTTSEAQLVAALESRSVYQKALQDAGGRGDITTEITAAGPFYFAEGYHQQYLDKNPGGYCGIGGTGVVCPVDLPSV
ncbi:MAG: peptide-methionine (S)-S-oxide reductase MsrA [Pseudomonadota bacterium]